MSDPRFLLLFAAGIVSACAASSAAREDDATVRPATSGWSGSFQPTQERSGVLAPTKLQQAAGTVRLRQSARDPRRTAVSLVVSASLSEPTALRWAVLNGRCGVPSLPLLGYDQFAPLEVTSSGRGQLDVDLPLELPQTGSYHVNVYVGGTDLDDVLTCANLKRA
jgi:hypothetical protein